MSEKTTIAWTDCTANFWEGCVKISDGCKNCYAEARDQRFTRGSHWGKGAPRLRHRSADAACVLWNKRAIVCDSCGFCYQSNLRGDIFGLRLPCKHCGADTTFHRRRVFSLSLGDWLDDEVPIEWLAEMLDVIRRCPNLDFLLLTKRPQNWLTRFMGVVNHLASLPPRDDEAFLQWLQKFRHEGAANIWLGVSVENQETADERIPLLLSIPAAVRFVSFEPALEGVNFSGVRDPIRRTTKNGWLLNTLCADTGGGLYERKGIDWLIVGGESGLNARPFNVEWARSAIVQCQTAGVACFVKQLGSNPVSIRIDTGAPDYGDFQILDLMKDKKGGDMSEWAKDLRVREFPKKK